MGIATAAIRPFVGVFKSLGPVMGPLFVLFFLGLHFVFTANAWDEFRNVTRLNDKIEQSEEVAGVFAGYSKPSDESSVYPAILHDVGRPEPLSVHIQREYLEQAMQDSGDRPELVFLRSENGTFGTRYEYKQKPVEEAESHLNSMALWLSANMLPVPLYVFLWAMVWLKQRREAGQQGQQEDQAAY